MAKKSALITGITGQDGSYLAEFLLSKDYKVFGLTRRTSTPNYERIKHIEDKIQLIPGDLLDQQSLITAIEKSDPDEIYNLAAQSFVETSWSQPVLTGEFTALGVTRMLEAQRQIKPKAKFYQASSSEMFGRVTEVPQKETTPFYPCSPYGCAKVFAYHITRNYRESYGLFACNGILFNHESPRRGQTFVTRKITMALCNIKLGNQEKLYLGNMDAKRDWGYAKEYVESMWLMLQQEKPDDYVVATGETHTVREFVEESCKVLGMEIEWKGKGINEKGIDKKTGKTIVEIDPQYFRPTEVDLLLGDPSKAKRILGWEAKTKFKDLVKVMIESDLDILKNKKVIY